jgi:hypothetical protein
MVLFVEDTLENKTRRSLEWSKENKHLKEGRWKHVMREEMKHSIIHT